MISQSQLEQLIHDNKMNKRKSNISLITSFITLIFVIFLTFEPTTIANAVKHSNNHHHTHNHSNMSNRTFIPTPTFAPIAPTMYYPTRMSQKFIINDNYNYNSNSDSNLNAKDDNHVAVHVGDFKYSFVKDNHDGWLLCNGSMYLILANINNFTN